MTPRASSRHGRCCRTSSSASSAYDAADGADALVIVTEWDAFRALDLGRIKSLKTPLLVDLRNIYPPIDAERAGLTLVGVGKPKLG
jgi:UDPglucose 6-dehydrogenase